MQLFSKHKISGSALFSGPPVNFSVRVVREDPMIKSQIGPYREFGHSPLERL
jgi:hypothetical protein